MDILAGAAGALARNGGAMVVELQRDADDLIALVRQQPGHHRRIDPARHGDHHAGFGERSEEHTSELQSLMRISYAVSCLYKQNISTRYTTLLTNQKRNTHNPSHYSSPRIPV